MNFKKILAILVASFMLLAVSACGEKVEPNNTTDTERQTKEITETETEEEIPEEPNGAPIRIVSTIFPQYDWVRKIIGEKAENFDLTLLINSTVDLHSYQPSISDVAVISDCDLFIYVGGHSDKWVKGVLENNENAVNEELIVINLVEELGEDVLWTDHVCEDEECEDDHGEEGFEEDEHVWMSLRAAQLFCEVISEAIIALDPNNEEVYIENTEDYIARLSALDEKYTESIEAADKDILVFADRFPFLYLTTDYGLEHFAAFSGCSAESEASISTIVILSRKLDQLELEFIMVTETADNSIAETIIENTQAKNHKILVLNGFQAITSKDVEDGVTYLSVMESNLEILKEALA